MWTGEGLILGPACRPARSAEPGHRAWPAAAGVPGRWHAAAPRLYHSRYPAHSVQGTLLLNNVHKSPRAVLPLIKQTVDAVSRGSMEDGEEG